MYDDNRAKTVSDVVAMYRHLQQKTYKGTPEEQARAKMEFDLFCKKYMVMVTDLNDSDELQYSYVSASIV